MTSKIAIGAFMAVAGLRAVAVLFGFDVPAEGATVAWWPQ